MGGESDSVVVEQKCFVHSDVVSYVSYELKLLFHLKWIFNAVDRYHPVTQAYNFGAKTLLGGADTSAFVVLLATITRALSSTFAASTALTKGPQRF